MKSALDIIRKITNWIVIFFFAVVVVVVSAQVFARYVLGTSIRWADELSRFAFVWLIYLGGSVTIRDGRNVCFDLFLESRKGKSWKTCFTIVTAISILFLVLMTYFGCLVCKVELTETSPIMHWPMSVVCSCIPIGGVLMFFEEIEYWLLHKNDRDGEEA